MQDVAKAFDDWWHGQEGFALRSERGYDDIAPGRPEMLPRWLRAAFDAGVEAARRTPSHIEAYQCEPES